MACYFCVYTSPVPSRLHALIELCLYVCACVCNRRAGKNDWAYPHRDWRYQDKIYECQLHFTDFYRWNIHTFYCTATGSFYGSSFCNIDIWGIYLWPHIIVRLPRGSQQTRCKHGLAFTGRTSCFDSFLIFYSGILFFFNHQHAVFFFFFFLFHEHITPLLNLPRQEKLTVVNVLLMVLIQKLKSPTESTCLPSIVFAFFAFVFWG